MNMRTLCCQGNCSRLSGPVVRLLTPLPALCPRSPLAPQAAHGGNNADPSYCYLGWPTSSLNSFGLWPSHRSPLAERADYGGAHADAERADYGERTLMLRERTTGSTCSGSPVWPRIDRVVQGERASRNGQSSTQLASRCWRPRSVIRNQRLSKSCSAPVTGEYAAVA